LLPLEVGGLKRILTPAYLRRRILVRRRIHVPGHRLLRES
jgi:hypothetical protein